MLIASEKVTGCGSLPTLSLPSSSQPPEKDSSFIKLLGNSDALLFSVKGAFLSNQLKIWGLHGKEKSLQIRSWPGAGFKGTVLNIKESFRGTFIRHPAEDLLGWPRGSWTIEACSPPTRHWVPWGQGLHPSHLTVDPMFMAVPLNSPT